MFKLLQENPLCDNIEDTVCFAREKLMAKLTKEQ